MRTFNYKLVIGIALILLSIGLGIYVGVTIASNIPPAGYDTGAHTLAQFHPPFYGAGAVMFLLIALALLVFIIGIVFIALGTKGSR